MPKLTLCSLSNFIFQFFKCCLFVYLLSFPLSCQHPADIPAPELPVDTSISIEEAKSWFEQQYGTNFSTNSRIIKTETKTPLWNFAKEGKFKKGSPIVIVPLAYEKGTNLAAIFDDSGQKDIPEDWQRGHTLIRKLVIFKNKEGDNKAVIMYVVPSQKYKEKNPKGVTGNNFTGMILFKDYDEEDIFLEGWRMENGEVLDVFGSQSSGKSKKNNGRVMNCYFVTYGHWEQVNSSRTLRINGEVRILWQWVVDYTSYHCSGGGGGYFEGQLPPGGGGAGVSPGAYDGANNPQSQAEFILQFQGILSEREINHVLEYPIIMEKIKTFAKLYGVSRLGDVHFMGSVICVLTRRCINSEEESILGETGFYAINLAVYVVNAWTATDVTKRNFANDMANGRPASDCGVCTGNAFKHALFRILDAHSFGISRASRLGEAHERNSLPGDERNMDLFNNEVGLQIFSNPNLIFFQNTIMEESTLSMYLKSLNFLINNGNLQYIKFQNGDNGTEILVNTNTPGISPR
jgi:hypothetical protein